MTAYKGELQYIITKLLEKGLTCSVVIGQNVLASDCENMEEIKPYAWHDNSNNFVFKNNLFSTVAIISCRNGIIVYHSSGDNLINELVEQFYSELVEEFNKDIDKD